MSPLCRFCQKPAACFGTYESSANHGFACDDCCGHGNEDGWCTDLPEEIARKADWLVEQCDEETDRVAALEKQREVLRKALTHLLDDWERTSAGFPQHIEMRYACRDKARAALKETEEQ